MTNCFTKEDNLSLTFPVFVNAPPPNNDNVTNETYPHWPAKHYASAQKSLTTSTYSEAGHKRDAFVWSNRKNYGGSGFNYKPNDLPGTRITIDGTPTGLECRTVFSTVGLANIATRIQVRHIIGLDYSDLITPELGTPIPYAEWNESADLVARAALFNESFANTQWGVTTTYAVAKDKILLHPHNDPSKIDGVELDYEVQDGRSETVTGSFTSLIAADIHRTGKEAFLIVNPYNASGAIKSAITPANLATFLSKWDYLTLWLHSDNVAGTVEAAYDEQRAMLPATMTDEQWAKIVLFFELGGDLDSEDPGTTMEDADFVRAKMTEPGLQHPRGGVHFHRSKAPAGGDCSLFNNQKIRRIISGT